MKARTFPLVVLLAALALPGRAAGQSLLNSGGLGFPLDAVDARARALGSPGVALFGSSVLPTDPAAAADLTVPEVTFTLQHSWVDLDGPAEPTAQGARFPVIGVAYPLFDAGMLTLTFGGVLDQRWRVRREGEVELGGEPVDVTDIFVSDGGVSAARFGFARRLTSYLAVGVAAGRYTGDLRRSFTRRFDTLAVSSDIPPFVRGGQWSYGGSTLTGGAQVDVGAFLRMAGSVTWSGDLDADPSPETEGSAATFSIPTEYRLGVSGALTPNLSLALGMSYADWAGTGGEELGARAIFGYGGGIELDEVTMLGRAVPVRVGYRSTDLPFAFDGRQPTETLWTAGFGLVLAGGDVSRAGVDVAVESGDRSAGSLSESFWRATVTVRVAGS